ncbi:MAG: XRE family transcriptional regulator [Paludibacter sp.]|jgi:transcriptional regulator with XRE-family HTH domain|nr:XRE family transcriptional regulator [Paludibacter sp.]
MNRIGERIKRKREQLKLNLNELSRLVGISASALSQLENGKAYPTLITIKNIAEHLNTTVGELIGENENTHIPVIRKKEAKLITTNDFGADVVGLSYDELNKLMDTFKVRFPEKSNSIGLFNKHTGQLFGYMLKGELQLELDNQTYHLEEGDSVYFNAQRNFQFSNPSKYTAELLCVTSFKNN